MAPNPSSGEKDWGICYWLAESYSAARFSSEADTLNAFFTTPEPINPDSAMVLSRSRCVISSRGLSTLGGSAHEVKARKPAAIHRGEIRMRS